MRKLLIIVFILLILIGIIITQVDPYTIPFIVKNRPNQKKGDVPISEAMKYMFRESAVVDFDGDGTNELVLAFSKDYYFNNDYKFNELFVVYHEDKEIARSPKGFTPIYSTLPGNMKAYQFDSNKKKELLRLEAIAGTHHTNSLFMTIIGDKLLPVCKKENPDDLNDCIFYNTVGDLGIEDTDGDGILEITEKVDEYPPTGGRGRMVVWAIYKYNGGYFESQEGKSYNDLYSVLATKYNGWLASAKAENTDPNVVFSDITDRSIMDEARKENLKKNRQYWTQTDAELP